MPALNELNCAFNARIAVNGQEHMKVVRHHHKVVQLELASQGVGPKHVNKKLSFVLCLEEWSIHVGLTSGEKRAPAATILRRSDFRVSFTIGSG